MNVDQLSDVRVLLQLRQVLQAPEPLGHLGEWSGARAGRRASAPCADGGAPPTSPTPPLRAPTGCKPHPLRTQAYSTAIKRDGTQDTPAACNFPTAATNTTPTTCIVTKPPAPAGALNHVLVQPRLPCRGVEEWRTDACGREAIW